MEQSPFTAWESFYVIVGSSGAAQTGLQFVVVALIAESKRRSTLKELSAFSTPNVVHFCAVLLMSAILSAPWRGLRGAAFVLGACGVAGLAYGLLVTQRTRRQTSYRPVLEDWVWHVVLPLVAYTLLLVSAILLPGYPDRVLFMIGATSLLLLFIGIHNAWDAVTFFATGALDKPMHGTSEIEEGDLNAEVEGAAKKPET